MNNPRWDKIKLRAVQALEDLLEENEAAILEASDRSGKEATLQDKKQKFGLGFRITIDDEKNEVTHNLTWSYGAGKRTHTCTLADPQQPELPGTSENPNADGDGSNLGPNAADCLLRKMVEAGVDQVLLDQRLAEAGLPASSEVNPLTGDVTVTMADGADDVTVQVSAAEFAGGVRRRKTAKA